MVELSGPSNNSDVLQENKKVASEQTVGSARKSSLLDSQSRLTATADMERFLNMASALNKGTSKPEKETT